jgi:predicted transposase YbfD/YdcC
MTTQPVTASASASVMNKINNHISYRRKDIIILALTCYMKIDEEDINKKNIFIAATEEESEEQRDEPRKEQRDEPQEEPRKEQRDPSPHPPPSPYNAKYKYLYR